MRILFTSLLLLHTFSRSDLGKFFSPVKTINSNILVRMMGSAILYLRWYCGISLSSFNMLLLLLYNFCACDLSCGLLLVLLSTSIISIFSSDALSTLLLLLLWVLLLFGCCTMSDL